MSGNPTSAPAGPPTAPAKAVALLTAPLKPLPFMRRLMLTAGYLMRTDVHTFAFSVAANAILSFCLLYTSPSPRD